MVIFVVMIFSMQHSVESNVFNFISISLKVKLYLEFATINAMNIKVVLLEKACVIKHRPFLKTNVCSNTIQWKQKFFFKCINIGVYWSFLSFGKGSYKILVRFYKIYHLSFVNPNWNSNCLLILSFECLLLITTTLRKYILLFDSFVAFFFFNLHSSFLTREECEFIILIAGLNF